MVSRKSMTSPRDGFRTSLRAVTGFRRRKNGTRQRGGTRQRRAWEGSGNTDAEATRSAIPSQTIAPEATRMEAAVGKRGLNAASSLPQGTLKRRPWGIITAHLTFSTRMARGPTVLQPRTAEATTVATICRVTFPNWSTGVMGMPGRQRGWATTGGTPSHRTGISRTPAILLLWREDGAAPVFGLHGPPRS